MAVSTDDPRVARSRAAVMTATRELLVERGVAATTVEEIARRSGVAKTTIYRHWAGKAEVVFDVIEGMIGPPKTPDTGSFAGDLTDMAVGLSRGLNDSLWSAVLPSLIDAAQRDEELDDLHRQFAERRHSIIRQVIDRGRARGEVREDVSDEEILELVAGPLFYRRLVTSQKTSDEHARRVAQTVAAIASPDRDV